MFLAWGRTGLTETPLFEMEAMMKAMKQSMENDTPAFICLIPTVTPVTHISLASVDRLATPHREGRGEYNAATCSGKERVHIVMNM